MRRIDREVTDLTQIEDIIKRCNCIRVGFNDNGEVYIVPLNFGYEIIDDKYLFYFHGASQGRKLELIKSNNYVGFEMDTNYLLHEADLACSYSARFQSVIGNGNISIIDNYEDKLHGLSLIMKQATGKDEWEFNEQMVKAVTVMKLEVTKLSCKNHQ